MRRSRCGLCTRFEGPNKVLSLTHWPCGYGGMVGTQIQQECDASAAKRSQECKAYQCERKAVPSRGNTRHPILSVVQARRFHESRQSTGDLQKGRGGNVCMRNISRLRMTEGESERPFSTASDSGNGLRYFLSPPSTRYNDLGCLADCLATRVLREAFRVSTSFSDGGTLRRSSSRIRAQRCFSRVVVAGATAVVVRSPQSVE